MINSNCLSLAIEKECDYDCWDSLHQITRFANYDKVQFILSLVLFSILCKGIKHAIAY